MFKHCKLFASFTIAGALGLLLPVAAHAQDGLSVLSPGSDRQDFSQSAINDSDADLANAHTEPSAQMLASPLTVQTTPGTAAHLMPINSIAQSIGLASAGGPMTYHGGPVMTSVTIHPIFWVPSHLQNGASTGMTSHYRTVQLNMLNDYFGHGIGNINTQYYQNIGGSVAFAGNKGTLGTSFLDTTPYPNSACNDRATPGNCITDAQVQAEVQRVLNFAHLNGGLGQIFMVFTAFGEGSCFNSGGASCAYTQYCAYHSFYKNGSTPVIYSNEPYGNPNGCAVSNASPNNDIVADVAANTASHELSEAITDPTLNAWFGSRGLSSENGDLCNGIVGPLSWDGGRANQMWNGHFYLLQSEWDNHDGGCFLVGPA